MHYSEHALERMVSRQVTKKEVSIVVEYGEKLRQPGRVIYFIGDEIGDYLKDKGIHLRNVGVVLDTDEEVVISVIRTSDRKKLRLSGVKGKSRDRLSHRALRQHRRLLQSQTYA